MKPSAFSLSQNTTLLTVAAIAQKIISALFFFLVSWFIGTEQTAAYFNVFAAIAVFTVVADFGMNNVLTREAAHDEERAPRIFSQALSFKLMFGLLALVALGLSKYALRYPSEGWGTVAIAGITLWFDSLRGLMYSYVRAHKNVRFEAAGVVGAQTATTILGIIMLVLKAPLIMLIGVFMITSIGQTAYAAWCVTRKTTARLVLGYDALSARMMLREALPFAAAGIIAQLYAYQDAFIIHRYLPPAAGGDWARAYKLVYAFQLIPVSLGASAYPVISASFGKNPEKIVWVLKRSYEYLLLIACPIMVGVSLTAAPLFARYLHKFVPSLSVLEVLVWSLGCGFLWYIHGAALNGSRRQNLQTAFIGSACLTSIVINVLTVPRFGIIGAAWAAVISNGLLWLLGYVALSRIVRMPHRDLLSRSIRIFAATVVMAFALYTARLLHAPAITLVPIGVVSYGIGILIFRAVSSELYLSLKNKIPARFFPS